MQKRIVLLITVLSLMLCGCAGKAPDSSASGQTESAQVVQTESAAAGQSEKYTVKLTERQKKILRDEGLPEEYDRLTDSQKNAIVKIESALSYLEETYEDEFEYTGYVSGGLDDEYVTAKISGTLPEKIVTVYISYKNGKYSYFDNYEAKIAEEEYKKEITDFLSGYLDPADFQVYAEIRELRNAGESLVERAVGVPLILVNNVCSEEEVKAAAQAYAEWIAAMENKDGGGADFKVYRAEDYILINEFNYRDYLGKWIYELDVTVDADDTINIEKYES